MPPNQAMMAQALQAPQAMPPQMPPGPMPNPGNTGAGYQVAEQGYFDPMPQFSLGSYGQAASPGDGVLSDQALTDAMSMPGQGIAAPRSGKGDGGSRPRSRVGRPSR